MQKRLLAAELMLGGNLNNQGQSSVLEPAVIISH